MYNADYDNSKWYDQIYENSVASAKECPECEGEGKVRISCCGDNMPNTDCDLCPTCDEHCGDDFEMCESCNGEGTV